MSKKKIFFNSCIVILLMLIIFMIIKDNFFYLDTSNKNPSEVGSDLSTDLDQDTNGVDEVIYDDLNYKSKENAIGVIKISGTIINDIIMQGDDNDYYLNHDNDGNYNVRGSIYMDYRNSIKDRKLLIFGHNSESLTGLPFHDLEKFVDENFYKENKHINLILDDENSKWLIFSVKIISKDTNTHMKLNFNDEEWLKHIGWLKENSLYNTDVDVAVDDKIVILQTCYFKEDNTYLIISAKKI